jgi:uncharacterized protein involved in oxidation of intracellular sulfur
VEEITYFGIELNLSANGYYNLERMLGAAIRHGAQTGICGTCMDARAIREEQLLEGAHR